MYGDIAIAGEGLQNLGLNSAPLDLEEVGVFFKRRSFAAVSRVFGFCGLKWRTAPLVACCENQVVLRS